MGSRQMKWSIFFSFILIFILIPVSLANDTTVSFQGGTLRLENEKHVSLLSETLVFKRLPPTSRLKRGTHSCPPGWRYESDQRCHSWERWQADLTYVLKNQGPARSLLIGLPFDLPPCNSDWEYQGPGTCQDIEGFRTLVDGQSVAVKRLDQTVSTPVFFNRLYLIRVLFSKGQTRTLTHRYISYDINGLGGQEYRYLLRTGSSWAGPIQRVTIAFELPPYVGPCAVANLPYQRKGAWLHIRLTNWKPDRDLRITYTHRQLALFDNSLLSFMDTPKAVCEQALNNLSKESQRELAHQVELFYGAPHTAHPQRLLKAGPRTLCENVPYFAQIRNKEREPHIGLGNLIYLPDPLYPNNIPLPIRGCLKLLKQP